MDCDDPEPQTIHLGDKSLVFPGLVDTHNHPKYNVFRLWDNPSNGTYDNRDWQTNDEFKYLDKLLGKDELKSRTADLLKYAQIKALVGGTTTIQGTTIPSSFQVPNLIHSIENEPINKTVDIIDITDVWSKNKKKLAKTDDSQIERLFVHLGEGTNPNLREELETLKKHNFANKKTIVIHGTAFTQTEFTEMQNKGWALTWSPLSNLLLYGDTIQFKDAKDSDLTINLSPDWSITGSKNLLYELKVAYWWLTNYYSDEFPDDGVAYELVKMATTNPAQSINWKDKVGKIAVNNTADLLIIDQTSSEIRGDDNKFKRLVFSDDKDVLLVIVNGSALYGTHELMDEFRGKGNYEVVGCDGEWNKGINIITDADGSQTWDALNKSIKDNVPPDLLDSIFTSCDKNYFETLTDSTNLKSAIEKQTAHCLLIMIL